jgi:hypothetical protein
MILDKPRQRRKRNETRDITHPIRAALNALTGVRVARNNSGSLPLPEGGMLRYGLGVGSADLVGIVSVVVRANSVEAYGDTQVIGRAFVLEVKWPGEKPTVDQVRWLKAVQRLGGFATVVHSVEEALAAVDRCRRGEHE